MCFVFLCLSLTRAVRENGAFNLPSRKHISFVELIAVSCVQVFMLSVSISFGLDTSVLCW